MRILASAILLCAITSCSKSGIVGKWQLSGSEATVWEFSDNGAVRTGDIRGRYKFGDQDRIKIETPYATAVYQLKISGDYLALREPGGSKLEFTRIKETRR